MNKKDRHQSKVQHLEACHVDHCTVRGGFIIQNTGRFCQHHFQILQNKKNLKSFLHDVVTDWYAPPK